MITTYENMGAETYYDGGIYDKDLQYGAPGVSKGLQVASWANHVIGNVKSVLSVGCGNGHDVVYWLKSGKNAFGTEMHKIDCDILKGRIINAVAPGLPFKDDEFDLVTCCEVIEHIEPKTSKDFILDCCRLAEFSVFSIATAMDSFRTHINLKSAAEWVSLFENIVDLVSFQYKPMIHNFYAQEAEAVHYSEGVIAIARKGI